MAGIAELLASNRLDGIVAATPSIARRFSAKTAIVVQNFPVVNECPQHQPYTRRRAVIAYVGGIAAIRGIREMVQAMTLVPEVLNAKLIIAGTWQAGLEEEIRQMPGWRYVDFLGCLPVEEVPGFLSHARLGLVLFHPVANHTEAQPHKLFEYMSVGIPVIASDFPLWRKIVGGSRCGILVDPLNPRAIANAICWLLEHPDEAEAMGRRGREAVHSRFNWHNEGNKLLGLYRKLLVQNEREFEGAAASARGIEE